MNRTEQLAQWLNSARNVLLLGHVFPDGDTTGSVLALKLALEQAGKQAVAYLPGGVPQKYSFLPAAQTVCGNMEVLPFQPCAALAVDVSDIGRLGEGYTAFSAIQNTAVLDHHATNCGFGTVNCIDGNRASCGELALEVIQAMGIAITKDIARCLYTAICTDCGQFGFSNTNADTMRAAAVCIEAGADPDDIVGRLYRSRTLGHTKLLGLVLSQLHTEHNGCIAWAYLSEEMRRQAGASGEDKEGIVNYLVEISGVKVAFLAEQRGESIKLSLRAVKGVDVASAVAVPLGGGGHAAAAGVTLNMSIDEALPMVLELAKKEVGQ